MGFTLLTEVYTHTQNWSLFESAYVNDPDTRRSTTNYVSIVNGRQ